MADRLDQDWLNGRVSLGAAARWTTDEMRLVADLGYALAEQGRNEEAITVFEGLAALAPATPYFQSALGALRLRTGEPRRAVGHLEAALAADPQDLSALVNCGEACLQLGEMGTAVQYLQAAVRLGESRNDATARQYVTRAGALLDRWQPGGAMMRQTR